VDDWKKQDGVTLNKGKIFDTDGNQIGTYQRTWFDNESQQFNQFVFGMAARASATKQAIGVFAGGGALIGATGGLGLYFGGAALGTGSLTTLGNLGSAATGGAAFLNQLSRTDSRMFQEAFRLGLSATNTFLRNVDLLTQAVRRIRPDAQLHEIGKIVTVAVKVVNGVSQVIGQLP